MLGLEIGRRRAEREWDYVQAQFGRSEGEVNSDEYLVEAHSSILSLNRVGWPWFVPALRIVEDECIGTGVRRFSISPGNFEDRLARINSPSGAKRAGETEIRDAQAGTVGVINNYLAGLDGKALEFKARWVGSRNFNGFRGSRVENRRVFAKLDISFAIDRLCLDRIGLEETRLGGIQCDSMLARELASDLRLGHVGNAKANRGKPMVRIVKR